MATVVDAARKGISIVVGAATGGGANAGWFGDGRDGELNVADGETLSLEVAMDEGQIVKHYTNGYIGTGSRLTAANRCNGMVLLFTGDLTIKGTISMDKKAPLLNPMEEQCAAEVHVALCGGLKGGNGGAGGADTWGYCGAPGTGGIGFAFGGGCGGGSGGYASGINNYSVASKGGNGEPRPPIGTTIPYINTARDEDALYGAGASVGKYNTSAAYGGGGPGGSGAFSSNSNIVCAGKNGDAIGGGAVFLFVKGALKVEASGVITADGGNGGAGATNSGGVSYTGGGGAGGGGIIAIVHNGDYTISGSVAASGGLGGTVSSGGRGAAGADGSIGTVLITTLADLLAK